MKLEKCGEAANYMLINSLNFPVKMIDKAPRIFAARLGFIMSALIGVLFILNLKLASMIFAGMLTFFAGLEFFFAICIGCMIYTYLVLPFYKK